MFTACTRSQKENAWSGLCLWPRFLRRFASTEVIPHESPCASVSALPLTRLAPHNHAASGHGTLKQIR